MSEQMDATKKLVTDAGFPVLQGTPFCDKYLADHDRKCTGCESEAGCARMCSLAIVMIMGAAYKPKDFDDMIGMTKSVTGRMAKILDKDLSIQELKEVTL